MKTLTMHANFECITATNPEVNTTSRSNDIPQGKVKQNQSFIWPTDGHTAFPEVNIESLQLTLVKFLRHPIDFWTNFEHDCKVCIS
jgi:hypothetical protein